MAYDLIGELGRARRTTEVGGLHAVEDALESRLVDGPRDSARVLFVEEREERGSGQDHLGVLLLVEREQERLGPRYGAEHLHHEVRDAVTVTVEGGDDEGLAVSGQEQRVGGVYELGVVADVAAVLRGAVHLLLEHPLVDGGDGVLGATEDLGPHLARLDKGELRYASAYPARDLLCPVGDLVETLALAPLLGPVGVVDGHPYDGDGRMDAGHGVDAGDATSRAHDHGPVYALPEYRVGRADVPGRLRRHRRGLYAEAARFHRRRRLVYHPVVRSLAVLERQVVPLELHVHPGDRRVEDA